MVTGIVCTFASGGFFGCSLCLFWGFFFQRNGQEKAGTFIRDLVVMKDRALQENSFINSTANRAVCFQECFLNQT